MQVPFEIQLSLRQGTVYYMADRALTSTQAHYFIVVNADPLGDKILLLTVASSQADNVRRLRKREAESTVVEIPESEYSHFTKDTVIDCNQVFTKSLADLCDLWKRKEIVPKDDLPPQILNQLTKGVLESRLILESDKRRIRGKKL